MALYANRQLQNRNEIAIREIFDGWVAAVQAEDMASIRAHHDSDILMFDVPPPFLSRGLDAYMSTWETFYRAQIRPIQFNFNDVEIAASDMVAFVTGIGSCRCMDKSGQPEDVTFRLTMGLRKISDEWRITHEHHSVPAGE